jgi:hypothetical protein
MAVNIEHLSTEVVPEPEPPAQGGAQQSDSWSVVEKTREAYACWMRDRWRTAAEEFDD